MSEALEKWPCYLLENLLPRIYMILKEIDRRFRMKFAPEQGDELGIIAYDQVRMANLCMAACHKVNGVSGLHTEILRHNLFKGYVPLQPAQIINITNGVTPRRWLLQANSELARLISETLGTQDWVNNMPLIAELE